MSTVPDYLQGPFEISSPLGAESGEGMVRCKICLETAPVDDWQSMEHEDGCKYPTESYQTEEERLVIQTVAESGEWLESDLAVDVEAEASAIDWDSAASELEER